jgi:hypothetical protein
MQKSTKIEIGSFLTVVILAIIFFIGTSAYVYLTHPDNYWKWSSPDETANYTFAKLYADTGNLTVYEKYNSLVKDLIHPRSISSQDGFLKPVSFLGIILIYGKIGSLFFDAVIPYLTPFFGALGIAFFYLLIRELFGRKMALLSACLLVFFPAYVYYSARSMFHNVLFISLLILTLYFLVIMVKKPDAEAKKIKFDFRAFSLSGFAGIFCGLTVMTRTSELLWLAPLLIILWLFNLKKVGLFKLLNFCLFLGFAIWPMLYWNSILYNSPLKGGYPQMNQSITILAETGPALVKSTLVGQLGQYRELLVKFKNAIFYFGFKPAKSAMVLNYYFIKMFNWLFWPAAVGLFLLILNFKKIKKRHWLYLAGYLLISLILVIYYGSWDFHDNPDPNALTIGNSYTRYWLPIYLGAMPLAAYFLNFIFQKTKSLKVASYVFLISLLFVYFLLSVNFLLYGKDEGLLLSAQRQLETKNEFNQVLNLTENNSVIITQYHDKIFFPDRKVITGQFNDDLMNLEYRKLTDYLPVYYYNFTYPQNTLSYLNQSKLLKAGFNIKMIKKITSELTLYKLENVNFEQASSTASKI